MKNKIFALALAATAMVAVSCEEDYKLYDTGQVDSVSFNYTNSNYSADSVITYNFGYDIAQEHEIAIPVTLMGVPKSEARKIDIKVVADSAKAVAPRSRKRRPRPRKTRRRKTKSHIRVGIL